MRLLILACSQRKRPASAPALELYDGPAYRVVRKALRNGVHDVEVWILSAEHGLIPADQVVAPYDRRLTRDRAVELAIPVSRVLAGLWQREWDDVYIEAGKLYQDLLSVAMTWSGSRPVRWSTGAIGKRMQALKKWLHHTSNGNGRKKL